MNSNRSRSSPRRHWKPIFGVALVATVALGLPAPAPAAEPPAGSSAPIVVIAADGFGRYLGDILEAEGLNEYRVVDQNTLSPSMLAAYDVALLGPSTLSSAQVTTLSNWVTGGGNLIAMKPDKRLAGLLGLSPTAGTLSDSYLKVDTGSSPGAGIVADTMQFHGTADQYTLAGARQVAALYSTATTATANPAVTVKDVGTAGGQAAAFTYDLAKSVIYTRQGNPAWAGQERDNCTGAGVCAPSPSVGDGVTRASEMFWGAAPQNPQTGWIDLSKVAIPQADEQQRLLANLVTSMTLDQAPLPRFSYLPRGLKAAVVMTGDDHANGGTFGRFDAELAASPPGCSVADWQCVRSTSYIYPGTPSAPNGTAMTDAQAASYTAAGFEIALHTTTNCQNYGTPAVLDDFMTSQMNALKAQLPNNPASVTNRTHCIPWNDWAGTPTVEAAHGIGLDTTYYYWPSDFAASNPGLFTGSRLPDALRQP